MNGDEMQVLEEELREYLRMTEELRELADADATALRRNDTRSLARHGEFRRRLLVRLTGANHRLHQHRIRWERLPRDSRDPESTVAELIRRSLGSILRTVTTERLNERAWPRFRPKRELLATLEPVR